MFVQQVPGVVARLSVRRELGGFLGLAVERGLVHLQPALDHLAVGGDLVPGLDIQDVAHHHVVQVDLLQRAVPDHLGRFLGFLFRLQGGGLALLPAFGHGGHAVGDQDGDQHAHGFIPLRVHVRHHVQAVPPQHEQHHLDHQRHAQDGDHRIIKPFQNPLPQRRGRDPRQRVGTVLPPALLHGARGQSLQIHGHTHLFYFFAFR